MWEQIFSLAVGNGLWAVLFCILLFYLLRDSKHREERYTALIKSLSSQIDIIQEVSKDVKTIKSHTERLTKSVKHRSKSEKEPAPEPMSALA